MDVPTVEAADYAMKQINIIRDEIKTVTIGGQKMMMNQKLNHWIEEIFKDKEKNRKVKEKKERNKMTLVHVFEIYHEA